MKPTEWFLGLLDAIGSGPTGKSVRQCPAHVDSAPSLSVGIGKDGCVILRCHAGCSWDAILGALTLPARYLYKPPSVSPSAYAKAFVPKIEFPPVEFKAGTSLKESGYRLDAVHDYGDDFRVLRYRKGTKKEMVWESRNPHGEMVPGLLGRPTSALPLYRERDIRMAVAVGEPVILVESESSVDALKGLYGTTWAGGAGSVQVDTIGSVLSGYAHLVVIPDNDPPGLSALDALLQADLAPHVLMPDPGEDARDLYTRVGSDAFNTLLEGVLR